MAESVRTDAQKLTDLVARLEQLCDKWSEQAFGIEAAYGVDVPAARILRHCIGDVYGAIQGVKHG